MTSTSNCREITSPRFRAIAAGILIGIYSLLTAGPPISAASLGPASLTIYFIDVEGGQATLIVTSDRHSLLIDSGWAGAGIGYLPGNPHHARDANRILAATHDAGLSGIDIVLITHFHSDHMGGIGELTRLLPVHAFVDHGAPAPTLLANDFETRNGFTVYSSIRSGEKHLQPKVGDYLPIQGIEAVILSTDGRTISTPRSGAGRVNPLCSEPVVPTQDLLENPRSTGLLVRYGQFQFLDVGDLSGEPLRRLACPNALVGPVDVYLVAHHGGADAWDPAIFNGFHPRVAILNNGVRKGGARKTLEMLHKVKDLEDAWQLHLSERAGDINFPAPFVANLDESTAHWIKLTAHHDGSFEILNARTVVSKHYGPAP